MTGTQAAKAATFAVYPIPAAQGESVQVQLAQPATTATYTLHNLTKQVLSVRRFSSAGVQADDQALATHRFMV